MADKKPEKSDKPAPAPAAAAEAPAKKGGLPIKTIGVVAALMIAEAAVVYFVFKSTGPKPAHAAEHAEKKDNTEAETVEIEVVKDTFQNLQTGRIWFWAVEVYVQVKKSKQGEVEKKLSEKQAEIKEGINQIFARAQHSQLKEPDRQSLNRQITAYLRKALESESAGSNGPLFERVIMPKCTGQPGMD
jgi:flagellar basal body-associated protein FliL